MGAAAAVVLRKERDLVGKFQEAGALSTDKARTLTELRIHDSGVAWQRLTRRAVVREGAPGTWYVDMPSWEALRYIRHRMLFVILAIVLIALVGGLLLAPK